MNAIRQIADAMRLQERAPDGGWVSSCHVPISDLVVEFEGEDGDSRQYALMVKWDIFLAPSSEG